MSDLDDKTLQRLYDDDLPAEDRARVEAEVAQSPEHQQRLAALGQLTTHLREAIARKAAQVEVDTLWSRVAPRLHAAPRPRWSERLRTWLGASMGARPLRWVGAGLALTAMAVALTLLLMARPTTQSPMKPALEATTNQLDIEGLDFDGRHPDIYQIKDGRGTTTVIWVYPDDEANNTDQGMSPDPDGANDI